MPELPPNQFPQTRLSLIGRIRSGTEEERRIALGHFFESYQPALVNYLIKCKQVDPDAADELVQDFVLNKVMTGKVLEYAEGNARFRDTLRTCVYRDFISSIRKKTRDRHADWAEPDQEADREQDLETLDEAWAVAIMSSALVRMREESPHWELYVDRVLTHPPVPYHQMIERLGYESPTQASNCLVNAKRNFNRIMAECIEAQSILSGEFTPEQLDEEIALIRNRLASSKRITDVVDSLRDSSSGDQPIQSLFEHSIVGDQILFVDESVDQIWNKVDAGQMLTHLLDQPIVGEIPDLAAASAELSFRELLTRGSHSEASLADLQQLKEWFNRRSRFKDGPLPERVNVTMTFALIAKYVAVGGAVEDVTSMRRDQLTQRLSSLVDRPWIDAQLRGLFREAVTRLLR